MPDNQHDHSEAGFSLLELAIVLVISGILLTFGLKTTTAYMDTEARKTTKERLAAIEEALVLFGSKYKRLPCPADGTLGEASTSNGQEELDASPSTTACKTGLRYSVVPWRALGIGQEVALDGWRRKITYRAFDGATGVTRPNGIDMANCKSSGTATAAKTDCVGPTPPPTAFDRPTAFLKTKGLTVNNGNSANKLMDPTLDGGGAAFVLVSHGKDGRGAYLPSGAQMPLPPSTQVEQTENVNDASTFADAPNNENASDPKYFDDVVARRSIDWVAVKARLGPN